MTQRLKESQNLYPWIIKHKTPDVKGILSDFRLIITWFVSTYYRLDISDCATHLLLLGRLLLVLRLEALLWRGGAAGLVTSPAPSARASVLFLRLGATWSNTWVLGSVGNVGLFKR